MNRLYWSATGLACIAAIIQPFAPMWLFLTFIIGSLTCSGIGWIIMQRRFRHAELVAKMDKAFGKPKTNAASADGIQKLRGGFKP